MLVYRARLDEAAAAVLSVTARTCRAPAPGLGAPRLRSACAVMIRYAAAGGRIRRHRGTFLADLPDGAALRVVACQTEGAEALVSLRPAPGARRLPRGAALSDRFALPVGLQAWGVTSISGVQVALRLACRAREGELILRGIARFTLETPSGTFRLGVPFLRVVAADVPAGLHWAPFGGVTGLTLRVAEGGSIRGEAVLSVRCEGRVRASAATPPSFALIREATARVARVEAEPAGPGHALVRGALDLDLYGTDGAGCSRWAGRSLPFAALLAVADGDRLEAFARLERLSHGPAAVQAVLAVGVTALVTETVFRGHLPYRAERIAGTAATTLVLTEHLQPASVAIPQARVEWREGSLPGGGTGNLAVALTARAQEGGRWQVSTPQGATGGTVALAEGEALAVAPGLVGLGPEGVRVRTALVKGPALQEQALPKGRIVKGEIDLPGPTRAVAGLSVSPEGEVTAIAGATLIRGRVKGLAGRPVAATAYPILHGDAWRLCVVVTEQADEERKPAGQ